jgi:regulation of enolase protein 1 (concanavalin A-like superfamily)
LFIRNGENNKTNKNQPAYSLTPPAVSWGRLTGYVWLRLQRRGNYFIGSVSYDGKTWKTLPDVVMPLNKKLLTGITVSSGMPKSTIIFFDNVSIHRRK